MDAWLVWLFLAVVLGITEVFTLTAVLGLLGGAALITAGFAATGLPLPIQLIAFAALSGAGLVVLRPFARRQVQQVHLHRFGTEVLIGRRAVVLEDVSDHEGTVRIGGEEWSARPLVETQVIPAGATVDVLQIEGATAIVFPRE